MAIVAVFAGLAIFVSAILQGDVPDVVGAGTNWLGLLLHRSTYLASYGLLYITVAPSARTRCTPSEARRACGPAASPSLGDPKAPPPPSFKASRPYESRAGGQCQRMATLEAFARRPEQWES